MNTRLWSLGFLLLATRLSTASMTVYSAKDELANSYDPHPNSNAMAEEFDSAAALFGPCAVLDWESVPKRAFTHLDFSPTVSVDGINAGGQPLELRDEPLGGLEYRYGYNTTVGGSHFLQLAAGFLTFNFSVPTHSFGAFLGGVQNPFAGPTGYLVFEKTSGLQSVVGTFIDTMTSDGGMQFLGVTDTNPIVKVVVVSTGDVASVDDVRFNAVPEPASILGLALTGFALARRRKKAH